MADRTRTLVVVPAAGAGQRFRDAGFKTPKPLIRFAWQGCEAAMLQHAVSQLETADYCVTVVHRRHDEPAFRELPQHYQRVQVDESGGQAGSVLAALRQRGCGDEEVLVVNCDGASDYPLHLLAAQGRGADMPAALVFPGYGSTDFSYVSDFPVFWAAKEKWPCSPWALAGFYYFPHAAALYDALEEQMARNLPHAGEHYLSGTFRHLGACLAVAMEREQLHAWGTPEDLARARYVRLASAEEDALLKRYR